MNKVVVDNANEVGTPHDVGRSALHRSLSVLFWLLPASSMKNWLLRRLGNDIGGHVAIGPTFVLSCGHFDVSDGARIATGNVFRRMSRVEVGKGSEIGNFNFISASPEYQRFDNRAGILRMGEETIITNRHYLDCSGMVELEYRAMIAGVRNIVQSHEIDIVTNRTTIGSTVIGERSFVATSCLLLKNAHVPHHSFVAAGSVVLAKRGDDEPRPGVYAGSPAKWKSELPECAWWTRGSLDTFPQSAQDFDASFD